MKDAGVRGEEIKLYVDEFEVLDGSVVEGVVREGDLVCVKWVGGHAKRRTKYEGP